MLVAIREDVTRVLCNVQFQEAPPAPPPPEFITTHFDPLTGEDNSRDNDAGTLGLVTTRVPPLQIAPPGDFTKEEIADWANSINRYAPSTCRRGRQNESEPGRARVGQSVKT